MLGLQLVKLLGKNEDLCHWSWALRFKKKMISVVLSLVLCVMISQHLSSQSLLQNHACLPAAVFFTKMVMNL